MHLQSVADPGTSGLDAMLVRWSELDDPPPLAVTNATCEISGIVSGAGVPTARIEFATDREEDHRVVVRWHDDRTFAREHDSLVMPRPASRDGFRMCSAPGWPSCSSSHHLIATTVTRTGVSVRWMPS